MNTVLHIFIAALLAAIVFWAVSFAPLHAAVVIGITLFTFGIIMAVDLGIRWGNKE